MNENFERGKQLELGLKTLKQGDTFIELGFKKVRPTDWGKE